MIYLFLSILSSTLILLIFRFADRYRVHTFRIIVINYITAGMLGFLISKNTLGPVTPPPSFYLLPVILGLLFIIGFFLIARSSQTAGVGITSVASKMSVVFPIMFSIAIDPADGFSLLKSAGIITALLAVYLTIRKKKQSLKARHFYFPVLIFFVTGFIDSLVKYAQYTFIDEENLAYFTAILFSIAAVSGIIISIVKDSGLTVFLNRKILVWGSILGIANFGSIYFLISALNHKTGDGDMLDSSVIFGINSAGIVSLSVITGLLIFKEHLSIINYTGILLSVIAILILTHTIN